MSVAQNGAASGANLRKAPREADGSTQPTAGLFVLLPPLAAQLAPVVVAAGAVPIVDATGDDVPVVPDGAWVRMRAGTTAPGTGPVLLAGVGSSAVAPIAGRPTWLETTVVRDVPSGFSGLVLKGREAGGPCGEEDGLSALSRCPDPSRVIVDCGVGPDTAAAAAALGAHGVLIAEQILGCADVALPPGLARRLELSGVDVTNAVNGVRAAAGPTAAVWRQIAAGEDPWALAAKVWKTGDPVRHLWLAGQGLALARELARRHGGSLADVLSAYREAWEGWRRRLGRGQVLPNASASAASARSGGLGAARADGAVGSAVLWQEAVWAGRPIAGGPLLAALATGADVVADPDEVAALRKAHAPRAEVTRIDDGGDAVPGSPAVAIIGIGCRFPGGSVNAETYWKNIVGKKYAIGEVPRDRWDPALFFDPDDTVPDKTYTRIGGFLSDFVFDGKPFRIPPNVARQVDPVQQLTLVCVADALRDAGLKLDKRAAEGNDFDRERCAVILGNSVGGEITDRYAVRLAWPEVAHKITSMAPFCDMNDSERTRFLAQMELAYKAGLPIVDEDSMPGELANVIAGRITNAFDLGGANFTVDAACASSMAAIQAAVKSLQDGESDIVLSGGADRSMNVATYVKFCKIGALSPDHSSPFDASANGFVMGEGCGILVLKRVEDAVRDNDRIYAIIRGIGASSDGRGKGITAPNPTGQVRALRRAYEAAGVDVSTIDLVEAHGTSTVVGDKVEVEALNTVIGAGRRGARGPVRIGSVKSMIGHLKSAAGAASITKTALALYHGVIPPSLNFSNARDDVPLDVIPLRVQTEPEPWPDTPDGLRRAGVSAFGFGGTNFHLVLESYGGQPIRPAQRKRPPAPQVVAAPSLPAPAPVATSAKQLTVQPAAKPAALPDGVWATSGMHADELVANLEALKAGRPAPFHASAPLRIGGAPADPAEREEQLDRAIAGMKKGTNPDLLRARGIAIEDVPFDRKLVFLFTGQGSQYLDMGLDLAARYPVVAETFAEADRVLTPQLGRPISDYMRLHPGEDADAKEEILRRTEYSQPATLTVDVALLRLLVAYGVVPDMVAGHSLGEYGAAVAAGVMTFEQSLYAVSARGREMASIRIDDPGKMAGIAASSEVVDEVLADVDGYVIAANKNCPTQTVIAGASDAVEEACERFKARNITVYPLPVSHAFHSAIVAPASEPLRGVLRKLGLKAPQRPITTNVTGDYYPTGDGAVERIIDLLAQQISAPVEWTAQMERMYEDDGRVFIEIGPKRALSGFTVSILKRRPHRALYTNHPKRGGVESFRDALVQLLVLGIPVRGTPLATSEIDLFAKPEPRRATTQALTAYTELNITQTEATPDLREGVLRIVAKTTGYDPPELDLDHELEADLGIDTVKQAEVFSVVRETYGIPPDPSFSFSDHKTLRALIEWAAARTGARRVTVEPEPTTPTLQASTPTRAATPSMGSFLQQASLAGMEGLDAEAFSRAVLPAVQHLLTTAFEAAQRVKTANKSEAPALPAPPVASSAPVRLPGMRNAMNATSRIVASGAAIGLPGGQEVFAPDNFLAMLTGRNRISPIGPRAEHFLDMGLVRLVKDPQTGQGSFLPVQSTNEVIRLAGTEASFDLRDYGIDEEMIGALDITTRLAFAAGLEALRDAGIPLVRAYKTAANGKKVPQGWGLPESLRDGTGVVFGSAFPGYDMFARHLKSGGRDANGRFDRRFLFQVLAMGHSQFAQLIGARGPNTQINSACASSTQGLAIADDWIRTGRCERVIVVGSDDVTSDAMLPWIGGGFMAAGAASTLDVVEEAALPFDRRRHGLILGMGAVGIVIETEEACRARGVVPLGTQLGVSIVNSAFHGTRLDVDHIAQVMRTLIEDLCRNEGISAAEFAQRAFFMSHETYTPARGGSAAAEIEALRTAFGPAANQIVVTNTKGFTGHPMGAGIEDGVALKALQYGIVPPVANLKEPDEALGDLTLSRGERRPFEYSVRLAAGFGSQLAISVYKREAQGDDRVDRDARIRWLREVTGYPHVEERIEHRTLRALPADEDRPYDLRPDVTIEPTSAPPDVARPVPTGPRAPAPVADHGQVLQDLIGIVATKTGYDSSEIEPDFELEADLGVDTVKQAEILSDITARYGLERDETFRIADYPSVASLAGYLAARIGSPQPPPPSGVQSEPARATPPAAASSPAPATPSAASDDIVRDLIAIVAEKTGYDPGELDPTFELEADLGIDTVKQAEILSELTAKFGLDRDESFRLADYPTITALAGYFAVRTGPTPASSPPPAPPPTVAPPAPAAPAASASDYAQTLAELMDVVAEKTGYDLADLEPSFELEADLGVDTVKQAEILSALQDRYRLTRDDGFRPADHPTLEALARYLHARRDQGAVPMNGPSTPAPSPATPLALPPTFRIRRVTLTTKAGSHSGTLTGSRVRILGSGELARTLRAEIGARGATVDDDGTFVIDVGDDVLTSFVAARAATGHRPERWITATRLGGLGAPHAVDVGTSYRDGARAGFTKALLQEWRQGGLSGAVVDVHPDLPPREAAKVLCDELASVTDREVFYAADGVRRVVHLVVEAPPRPRAWSGRPAIVLTGGARGITARVAQALAARGPTTLVLVGRSPVATTPLDEQAAKERIRADIQAAGERVTPARVEAALVALRRSDEARRNLDSLRALGATVHYIRADLADPAAVQQALREIEALVGRIDVLIHGAGTEESRQIQDKDEDAFHRVFDGKAVGGRAFIEALAPSAYVVSMGSVAGRFGNPGQVDYAAANDALARMCHTRPGSLHVDWTAWDDVGMAVRGGMRTLLGERGVDLLPADAGASLLADFVLERTTGELIVAGELGDFEPANPGGTPSGSSGPGAGGEELVVDGDTARLIRVFSRGSDPWLVDHAIEGVPVLPGVIGLELMTQAARALCTGMPYAGARDVRFDAPVKVHREEPTTVIVEARRVSERAVATRLFSTRTLKTGRVQQVDHFSAVVDFGEANADSVQPLPSVFLPDESVDRAGIYRRFFHGPIFQVLRAIHSVSADGLVGDAAVDHAPFGRELSTAPLVLEAAFQAAGLHRMIVRHELGLPQRLDEVRLVGVAGPGVPLAVTVQLSGDQYHVDVDGPDGPILRLRGFSMIPLGPVPPGDRFEEPPGGRPICFPTVVQLRAQDGWAIEARAAAHEAAAHADEDPTPWLTENELQELAGRGTDRRVRDRIAGRMAAKRALAGLTGVDPLQIRVLTAPSGEPVAVVPGYPSARVSITHREGRAIAVAVAEGRVGVDMERVEDRGERFAADWFTDEERRVLDSAERLTIGWAIKEAVLKWLGTGLQHAPHDVRILAVTDGRAEVQLLGDSANRYRALGADPLQVHWGTAGADEIVVTVRTAA